jgi:hypothetical protein
MNDLATFTMDARGRLDRWRHLETVSTRELYDKMRELYPDLVNPGLALWLSARAVKP